MTVTVSSTNPDGEQALGRDIGLDEGNTRPHNTRATPDFAGASPGRSATMALEWQPDHVAWPTPPPCPSAEPLRILRRGEAIAGKSTAASRS